MTRSAHGVIGQRLSQSGTPPAGSPTLPGRLFLSGLLNIPNGVASQVRCVLIMTLKASNVKGQLNRARSRCGNGKSKRFLPDRSAEKKSPSKQSQDVIPREFRAIWSGGHSYRH